MRQFSRRTAKEPQEDIFKRGIGFQSKPLRFVLISMRRKANQIRNLRKNPSGRMRKQNRLDDFQLVAFADRDATGVAVALLIEREHQRVLERRREEGACGMAKMMFEVQNAKV